MISILLSCYKSNFEYLEEQIDSIFCQTEEEWELLIYNDGTKNLKDFLWTKYFPLLNSKKIKYFDEGHKGCVGAFNYLFERAKGEYICICDHDDIWMPEKLFVQKKYLDDNQNTDCVFSWLRWFGEKDKLEMFEISDFEISKELYFWDPVKNPSTMFRKNRFTLNDCPFDKASDFWYWAKHKQNHYHLIKEFLVKYRRHSGELTKDKSVFRENSAKVIQKNLADRFQIKIPMELCRKMDRYSNDYNEDLKKLTESFMGGIYIL